MGTMTKPRVASAQSDTPSSSGLSSLGRPSHQSGSTLAASVSSAGASECQSKPTQHVVLDRSPLPPPSPNTFSFPRTSTAENAPFFPLYRLRPHAAEWTARLGSEAWAAAARTGRLADISETVLQWAVVDSVLERWVSIPLRADGRHAEHRRRMYEDRRARIPQPPRLLRDWEAWVALTDDMIFDAFEVVSCPRRPLSADTRPRAHCNSTWRKAATCWAASGASRARS